MTIRKYTTGTVTMTAVTDTQTISNVTGRIKSIAINPSGTSTNFKITCAKAGIVETILGATPLAVAAVGTVIAPQKLAVDVDGGALTATSNTYVDYIVINQDITIAVTNGANAETYVVDIIVDE